MQYRSCRSPFSTPTVQVVSDMICLLFSLAWRVVFAKQNYSLRITRHIIIARPIVLSDPRKVVNMSLDTIIMVPVSSPMKDSSSF